MKKVSLFIAAVFGATIAFGAEGDVGTQAYQWSGYSDLAPTPTTYSLSNYLGKVVLMNAFQYNCSGCDSNAPMIGRIADSIGSGKSNVAFQGIGTEIDNGTYAQIQASYSSKLKSIATNVNYPLVHVPNDTAIRQNYMNIGTYWNRYNTFRDVYFVIDATGKITFRLSGDRLHKLADSNFAKIRNAIGAALATAPTNILCLNACGKNGLKASRQSGGFHFSVNSSNTPVIVQIMDLQGRNMRTFSIQPSTSGAVWNGLDAHGNAIPYGTYFLRATGSGISTSQRISWQP